MSSDASQAADLELQFKKRARRRLVGAIALVLVMLAVLPMVLDDHEHSSPQQAVTISIPSQNAEFTTQSPLKAPEPEKPAPIEIAPNPVIETPTAATPKKQDDQALSDPANPPVVKNATEKKLPETKKAEQVKKIDESKEKSVNHPKETLADKSVKVNPSLADKVDMPDKSAAETKNTEPKMTEDSGKPYYLQIGVFSDSVNVTLLQKKLSELKLKTFTEKISTDKGDKTRLRVGPFENKDQADHAAEKVKTIGLSGFVSNK